MKQVKILLIDPPFYRFMGIENRYFPIGLGYIAASLRDQGHEVRIYSADTSKLVKAPAYNRMHEHYKVYIRLVKDISHPVWQEILALLKDFQPKVVGITAMTPKIASVLQTASLCKDYDDHLRLIVGGPHATIKPDELLQYKELDFVIRGEGEVSILSLIQALQKDDPKLLSEIGGLSYRKNGEVFHNPPGGFLENLDARPFPARELLLQAEKFSPEDLAIIMTSRGCPFSCTFCFKEMFGKKVRYRSVADVIEEIKYVIQRYNAKQFAFKDDSFTLNKRRVIELCDSLTAERIKISWECTTRVDLIDEELLKKMMAAGCNTIKVGVESGSENILRLIKKAISLEQIRGASKLFNKQGIFWAAFFMMGLPNETEEDMYKTLKFMKELQPDYASMGVYEAYPGTELFEMGIELGLLNPSMHPSQYFERPPDEYYFKDPYRRVNTIEPARFEILCGELLKEFDNYNKGIKKLLKMAISRRKMYLNDPKSFIRDLRRALKWISL